MLHLSSHLEEQRSLSVKTLSNSQAVLRHFDAGLSEIPTLNLLPVSVDANYNTLHN